MTLQASDQTITIHILPDISKSKDNQTEIWSVNRIKREKYFSSEIMQKMRQEDYFQISFCFPKKLYMK